jgi:hypothetical protein
MTTAGPTDAAALYDRLLAQITELLDAQGERTAAEINPQELADSIWIDVLGHGSSEETPE